MKRRVTTSSRHRKRCRQRAIPPSSREFDERRQLLWGQRARSVVCTDIEQVAFVRCVSADATLALASEEWKDHPPKGARGARFSLREGRPESASTRSARTGQLTMHSHRVMLNRQASSVRHDRAAVGVAMAWRAPEA